MIYKEMLEATYKEVSSHTECAPRSRLEFLSEYIFNFTTYDPDISEMFAKKAVEVCKAINRKTTFKYIKDGDNYKWYLLMCNMPFFSERLEWGTSIRGAWWGVNSDGVIEFDSCDIWFDEDKPWSPIKFSREEWEEFVAAIIDFASPEIVTNDESP